MSYRLLEANKKMKADTTMRDLPEQHELGSSVHPATEGYISRMPMAHKNIQTPDNISPGSHKPDLQGQVLTATYKICTILISSINRKNLPMKFLVKGLNKFISGEPCMVIHWSCGIISRRFVMRWLWLIRICCLESSFKWRTYKSQRIYQHRTIHTNKIRQDKLQHFFQMVR